MLILRGIIHTQFFGACNGICSGVCGGRSGMCGGVCSRGVKARVVALVVACVVGCMLWHVQSEVIYLTSSTQRTVECFTLKIHTNILMDFMIVLNHFIYET